MSDAIEELLAVPKFGDGIGFRRMQVLLRTVMDSAWARQFTTIRVTGSNGKGSVVALVHSILRNLEPRCGRYTSPHLLRFHERIVIGETEITDSQLDEAYTWIRQTLHEAADELAGDRFGSFELITALCLRSFFQADLRVGVMEAGIGGRYDPTRLLPGNLVALTSIDLEHTDLLGKTKELVACDKLDLCPDQGTVVSVRNDPALWERISAYCRMRRVRLIDARSEWQVEALAEDSAERSAGMPVRLTRAGRHAAARVPLVGTFQLDNIAVACSLVEQWAQRFRPEITPDGLMDAVVSGLQQVRWPARFEQISTAPPVFVDVAHSPDACLRLVETVRRFLHGVPILLVTGVSSNKAVDEILQILVPVADSVICTRAYHQGEQVDRIEQIVRGLAETREVLRAGTIEQAAELARQMASERGLTVLVAGGLFLAVEFRAAWQGCDPQQIRFY